MRVSAAAFKRIAREMLELPTGVRKHCNDSERHTFRAHFGASFKTMSVLWTKLDPHTTISSRAEPKHLLWTLVFFKVHKTEPIHLRITRCKSRDTFRNWVYKFASAIADLSEDVIDFANRFQGWNGRNQCLTVLDGTDVKCTEPVPRGSIWWSHKYNGAGLRYEVAMCIATGDIVWFNGPFPPCNMSDREIFDLHLDQHLIEGEGVEADSGYTGRVNIFTPGVGKTRNARKQKSQARARLESTNGLFKVFGVMKKWENHDTAKHGTMAKAVAVIVQLSFSCGERLYDVEYNVNYD